MVDSFKYKLVRSKRKSLSLQVNQGGVLTVRAPRFLSKRRIDNFIVEKSKWIRKKQDEMQGKQTIVEEVVAKREHRSLEWYKKMAKIKLSRRVEYFAEREGFSYKQVRIGSAMTRWGSCGPTGNLNFTWRLILAPDSVIDYVVVHELAHLEHKNHSSRFWAEVERMMPDWKVQRKWLKTNGFKLTLG